MRNDEFITWLKGFVAAIDSEYRDTVPIGTWKKIKEELGKVEESETESSSTPTRKGDINSFTTTTLPPGYTYSLTAEVEEGTKIF